MFGVRRRRRLTFFLPSLFLTLSRLAHTSADADLTTRDTAANVTIPAPISVSPAQNWEGIDGTWNTFTIQVGTPPQTVRVQISTASQQTWVVAPRGCEGIQISDCADNRGGIFTSNKSSTWEPNGAYLLWTESNLGYEGAGDYGWDVVTLGGAGGGGPTLKNTTVGGIGSEDFWFGHFGVNPKSTNWTSFNDPSESYMTLLKDANKIPSVSFGYTAGAQYRFDKVLSSLTLGGYDSSRFAPNDIEWDFQPDNERDLVVAIKSISSVTKDSKTNDGLLPNPIYAYIDSTVPQIWLPLEACLEFEKQFGLSYDNDSQLYLVNDNLHTQLLDTNPNITFTIGTGFTGGSTVAITLPYAAFDLQASPPYQGLQEQQYYFPLRRAANNTQFTLGRTFLQEAYLTVDWEREKFNVSQCAWSESSQSSIVAIRSINDTSSDDGSDQGTSMPAANNGNKSSGMSTGAIIGIAVGIGLAVAVVVCGLFFFFRRRRNQKRDSHEKMESPEPGSVPGPSNNQSRDGVNNVYPKVELDANQTASGADKDGDNDKDGEDTKMSEGSGTQTSRGLMIEADSKPRQIFEMPGDMPARQEAGGRQLSEKETMMVREARYNGTDPEQTVSPTGPPSAGVPRSNGSNGAPSPLTPRSPSEDFLTFTNSRETQRGRRLVQPGEVIELSPFERDNLTMGLVSPISGPSGSSDGHGTFSPLSPLGSSSGPSEGTATMGGISPVDERARRRFSYE